MKVSLAHAAVYTADLERMKEFYAKYFGARYGEKYQNADGFSSYFMSFDSGAGLEIMSHVRLESREVIDKVNGYSHLSFSVGSKEDVIALTERITGDGYKLYSKPRVTGDGYFESSVSDPDGNAVEITI